MIMIGDIIQYRDVGIERPIYARVIDSHPRGEIIRTYQLFGARGERFIPHELIEGTVPESNAAALLILENTYGQ